MSSYLSDSAMCLVGRMQGFGCWVQGVGCALLYFFGQGGREGRLRMVVAHFSVAKSTGPVVEI